MQEANIIDSIRLFILTCPFLDDYRVNVDHLSEDMSYSVDPLPCDPVLQRYVDGGKRSSFNLHSQARSSMTKMRGLILKILVFIRRSKSGWKSRQKKAKCQILQTKNSIHMH